MRLLSNVPVALSLSLLLTPGAAAEPATAPATQAPVDDRTINIVAQKLCRGEPVVGTRIAYKRKCDTPAQLAHYQAQAREIIEEYKRRPCMAGAGAGPNDVPLPC